IRTSRFDAAPGRRRIQVSTPDRVSPMRIVALVALLVSLAAPGQAAVVLRDDQDCLDWARTTDAIVWKQKDSALASRSLLKLDLADLGVVQPVHAATLRLFIERGQAGATLLVYHVHDPAWSYRYSD